MINATFVRTAEDAEKTLFTTPRVPQVSNLPIENAVFAFPAHEAHRVTAHCGARDVMVDTRDVVLEVGIDSKCGGPAV